MSTNLEVLDTILTRAGEQRLQEIDHVYSEQKYNPLIEDQIYRELLYLENLEFQLKRRRNMFRPIFHLPPEVLSEVLAIVALEDPVRPPPPIQGVVNGSLVKRQAELGWIKLGHVCNYLRTILHNFPNLWARSVCALPSAHEQLFRLSQNVPLSLNMNDVEFIVEPKTVEFATSQLHRASEIVVRESWKRGRTLIWTPTPRALSGRAFPVLKKLSLNLIRPRSSLITSDVYELPPIEAPNLRHVILRNVYVPMKPSNLTHLEISRDGFPPLANLPPWNHVLDILRFSPNLTFLRLTSILADDITPLSPDDAHQIIRLPDLREFSISDRLASAMAFWAYVEVSSTANVRFWLDFSGQFDEDDDDDDLSGDEDDDDLFIPTHDPRRKTVISALAPHAHKAMQPITGLNISEKVGDESLRVCFCVPERGIEHKNWTGPFAQDYALRLDVEFFRWLPGEHHFMDMFNQVQANFDLSRIEVLEIVSLHDFDTVRWRKALMPMANVQTLALESMDDTSLLFALCPPTDGVNGDSEPIILPNLRKLLLTDLDFDVEFNDPGTRRRGPSPDGFLEMLRYRARVGRGLQHLRIGLLTLDESHKSAAFVESLEGVIPQVECNTMRDHPVNWAWKYSDESDEESGESDEVEELEGSESDEEVEDEWD